MTSNVRPKGQKNGSFVGGNGVVLQSPKGDHLEYAFCLHFPMTNNKAEYETIIKSLNLAKAFEAESLVI